MLTTMSQKYDQLDFVFFPEGLQKCLMDERISLGNIKVDPPGGCVVNHVAGVFGE